MFNTYKKLKRHYPFSSNRGLTLIELMVVISIFLIITGVLIFDYGGFRSTVSLQNLADDIALSVRKAQSFAIGARGVGDNFSKSFGVHFSTSSTVVPLTASSKSFLMFSTEGLTDRKYELGTGSCGDPTNFCMELFTINTLDSIKEIRKDGVALPTDSYMDIVFTRPEPRAYFCYRSSVVNNCNSGVISKVDIVVSNNQIGEKLKTKTISIQNTGQISIE